MKNQLIGALVGGLILWIWQFASFGPLQLHVSQMQHTPNQEAIIEMLSQNLEEGQYFIPRVPVGSSDEEQQAYMAERVGKPWATVNYHSSMQNNFGMNLIRGFAVNFLAVFLLCWIFARMAKLDMKTCVMTSLFAGLIGYLTVTYINSAWFETNSIPELIDVFVGWGAVGLWLGYWLPGRLNP
ncbi:MAG: hypothetical protein AAFZ15_22850 [Bacteroidota bacterium]